MNELKLLPSLLVFAEVANTKSFTQAANRLGMSKSAISQHVKRLEQHIGQQLISRNTRGMSLTATGERLLMRCELLRDQVDLALEELTITKAMPSGPFAITFPHSCEKDIVIPALKQLCIEFPKIEPRVVVSDKVLDLIQDKLDVAISAGDLKDSNYRALPVGSAPEVLFASPGYIHKSGAIKVPEDLKQHRWIPAPWHSDTINLYKDNALNQKLPLKLQAFAQVNALPGVVEMVLQNMGVTLLPEYAVQEAIKEGNIVRVLPHYQGRQWPFYFIHRFHGEKPLHVTRFYQLVKYYFVKANQSA